ncbi:DUF4333 domain-containing protein [Mycolicibacterium sp.]|jgi:hypothetical protein|uniref:DUF4333 domain-containing protein n=1 Tax=Mycolicibacterium sp. TaxID=2320850 RepID=UPI001A2CE8B7|nr:DUF4333 domain-containing protein [Mycolicibacterium sp.]MBJ7400895.1 DUF4333 domain-containing protein [Mycolicibacterium sp.]
MSVNKSHGVACMAALAAAGLLGAGLSGCSKTAETTSTPSASATNLQKQLTGSGTAAKSALGVTPKQQLEDALLEELAANGGQAPDTVDCVGDLQATTGQTIECTVSTDLAGQVYLVTVTTVDGDNVNYNYAPKP